MNVTLEQQHEDDDLVDNLLAILEPYVDFKFSMDGALINIYGCTRDGLELTAVLEASDFFEYDGENGRHFIETSNIGRELLNENLAFLKRHYNLDI